MIRFYNETSAYNLDAGVECVLGETDYRLPTSRGLSADAFLSDPPLQRYQPGADAV